MRRQAAANMRRVHITSEHFDQAHHRHFDYFPPSVTGNELDTLGVTSNNNNNNNVKRQPQSVTTKSAGGDGAEDRSPLMMRTMSRGSIFARSVASAGDASGAASATNAPHQFASQNGSSGHFSGYEATSAAAQEQARRLAVWAKEGASLQSQLQSIEQTNTAMSLREYRRTRPRVIGAGASAAAAGGGGGSVEEHQALLLKSLAPSASPPSEAKLKQQQQQLQPYRYGVTNTEHEGPTAGDESNKKQKKATPTHRTAQGFPSHATAAAFRDAPPDQRPAIPDTLEEAVDSDLLRGPAVSRYNDPALELRANKRLAELMQREAQERQLSYTRRIGSAPADEMMSVEPSLRSKRGGGSGASAASATASVKIFGGGGDVTANVPRVILDDARENEKSNYRRELAAATGISLSDLAESVFGTTAEQLDLEEQNRRRRQRRLLDGGENPDDNNDDEDDRHHHSHNNQYSVSKSRSLGPALVAAGADGQKAAAHAVLLVKHQARLEATRQSIRAELERCNGLIHTLSAAAAQADQARTRLQLALASVAQRVGRGYLARLSLLHPAAVLSMMPTPQKVALLATECGLKRRERQLTGGKVKNNVEVADPNDDALSASSARDASETAHSTRVPSPLSQLEADVSATAAAGSAAPTAAAGSAAPAAAAASSPQQRSAAQIHSPIRTAPVVISRAQPIPAVNALSSASSLSPEPVRRTSSPFGSRPLIEISEANAAAGGGEGAGAGAIPMCPLQNHEMESSCGTSTLTSETTPVHHHRGALLKVFRSSPGLSATPAKFHGGHSSSSGGGGGGVFLPAPFTPSRITPEDELRQALVQRSKLRKLIVDNDTNSNSFNSSATPLLAARLANNNSAFPSSFFGASVASGGGLMILEKAQSFFDRSFQCMELAAARAEKASPPARSGQPHQATTATAAASHDASTLLPASIGGGGGGRSVSTAGSAGAVQTEADLLQSLVETQDRVIQLLTSRRAAGIKTIRVLHDQRVQSRQASRAAATIQACFRMFSARKQYLQHRLYGSGHADEELMLGAAETIQRVWRGSKARQVRNHRQRLRSRLQNNIMGETAATTKLAASTSSAAAAVDTCRISIKEAAAAALQRAWLCFRARRLLYRKRMERAARDSDQVRHDAGLIVFRFFRLLWSKRLLQEKIVRKIMTTTCSTSAHEQEEWVAASRIQEFAANAMMRAAARRIIASGGNDVAQVVQNFATAVPNSRKADFIKLVEAKERKT